MRFRVTFDGAQTVEVDSPFPSTAARDAAEQLRKKGGCDCTVESEEDGAATRWHVSDVEIWYARPIGGSS